MHGEEVLELHNYFAHLKDNSLSFLCILGITVACEDWKGLMVPSRAVILCSGFILVAAVKDAASSNSHTSFTEPSDQCNICWYSKCKYL